MMLSQYRICVVLRFLLLWRRSHLASSGLGPYLHESVGQMLSSSSFSRDIFSHQIRKENRPVVGQGQSCIEELMVSWVSGFQLRLSHPRLSSLSDVLGQTCTQEIDKSKCFRAEKSHLVTSLFKFLNTGAPSMTLPVLT